ncbi:6566_t:CDS:2 [Gigaspora margarita]|uniref:6566_t:CDS:1 n=1 Tax=Gigaspora margarita TaxID=4874 RepID=A0ABM8W4Q6_GIGMA|nr:6566_t:CDS:2 [Gigaspora margarita]
MLKIIPLRMVIQIPISVMEEHSYRLLDLYKDDRSNGLGAYSFFDLLTMSYESGQEAEFEHATMSSNRCKILYSW